MNSPQVLEALRRTGVLRDGHFLLTSGRHSDGFLLCSQILQFPAEAEAICRGMAELYRDEQVDTVVGPALGGIILAYEVARALGCRAIYAEKDNGQMILRRGFQLQAGERVLVVEDVMTTGGSVQKVIATCRGLGAQVVGVCTMVDRSDDAVDLGVPVRSLATLQLATWTPEACPLCRQGVPLTRPKS